MITALGLLDKGAVTADTPVNCPKTFTVEGRTFTNAGDFELGAVPFHTDFAKSCNTAFASLGPAAQARTCCRRRPRRSGWAPRGTSGTEANTGTVPANVSDVEAAAAAFGQGQTLVSPLVLAGAAAAVARGSWQQPKLFTERAGRRRPPPRPGRQPPANGTALNAELGRRAAGDDARGRHRRHRDRLLGRAGATVYAKTGTAEFDNNPADTHAWTIGWRGDIAFAVFVEKGGSSAATAVPIAAAFLRGF